MPTRPVLVEAIGREKRCEDREQDEHEREPRACPEHPARHTARSGDGPERPPDPDRPPLEAHRRGRHQYRTRGSMNAFAKSMTMLAATTTSAKTTTMPCTAA